MIDESRLYAIPVLNRPALVDVCTWAVNNHYLKSTSQMYSYEPTPFFEEPSHYMSDLSGTSCVLLKTPAQCGKSLCLLNFLGWMVEYYPSNTLLVLDSQKQGMKMSQNRVRPFLREVCGINNPNNSRNKNPDKSNSVVNIGLRSGANLFLASAKSASDSKSTPARFVLLDEVDAYPTDINGEGDPVTLFTQRTKRFRGMVIMTSTPTTEDGAITQHWKLGTAQTWGVECECGKWMAVRYADIDFTGDVPTIHCPHCGQVYSEQEIIRLKHCYNEPTNPDPLKDDFQRIRRSYEITAPLCHSFVSWDSLKRQELAYIQLGENSYKSFVNTVLGETYMPKDEIEIDPIDLARWSQDHIDYDCLPQDVVGITMGVDTHPKCLYCFIAAFSEDTKHIYGLDYSILVGSPAEDEVWQTLKEKMDQVYTRVDGLRLRPSFVCIDSGGHNTNDIYRCTFQEPRIQAIKGMVSNNPRNPDPLIGKLSKVKFNAGVKATCKLLMLGVNAGKDLLRERVVLTMTGEQCMHFPKGHGFDVDYFKGILSEKKIDGKWRGAKHINNEPLDTAVYALAAFEYWKTKFYKTGKDVEYEEALKELSNTQKPDPVQETQITQEPPVIRQPVVSKSKSNLIEMAKPSKSPVKW